MSGAGDVNGWTCRPTPVRPENCGKTTYVVHVDEGVTPMFLGCRATPDCEGLAVSLMYPADPPLRVLEAVAWEWYMPDAQERRLLDEPTREHVEKGGLLIRELTDAGREKLRAYVS